MRVEEPKSDASGAESPFLAEDQLLYEAEEDGGRQPGSQDIFTPFQDAFERGGPASWPVAGQRPGMHCPGIDDNTRVQEHWGAESPLPTCEEEFEDEGLSEAEVLLESEAATPVTPVAIENRGGGRTEDQREVCSDELETIAGVNERLVQLHRVAAAAWRAMVAAARADGLSEPLLLPISGHRTTLRQAELFRAAIQRYGSEREARRWVAPPGGSAHHTGRAMDLYLGGANTRANVAKLCSLPAWQWMRDNAARFGFYADDREPWHWEYNPPMQAAARAAEDKPEAAPEELEAGEFEDEGSTGGEGNLLETEAEAEFNLVAVENPGGGRIQDKRDPPASSLETVAGPGGDPVELHHLAAAAWRAMVAAARREGISSPMLLPTSGYRSREHQARLFADAVKKHGSEQEAGRWVARPGHSAHQSGRAIDLHLGGRNASANAEALRGLPAYQWLSRNAARFGFYPYPREPWHWEYNPPTKGSGTVASNPAQQSSESTPPASVSSSGSAELARFVQQVLNATQGEKLTVDGIAGPLTRAALERFRQRHTLGAGNALDTGTEIALVQKALEELARQSLFPQAGVLDRQTARALDEFKADHSGAASPTFAAGLYAALAKALSR